MLALGWIVYWLLRHRHARWRLILWRSLLCFGLVLPLIHFSPIHVFKIPIQETLEPLTSLSDVTAPAAIGNTIQPVQSSQKSPAPGATLPSVNPLRSKTPAEAGSWKGLLLVIWALGCVCGALRLVGFHIQLSRLKSGASLPSPTLQELAREIKARLGVKRTVEIRVSDSVTSPFVYGLLKPVIMLPGTLARDLSGGEVSALLSHEIAHLRQHDLVWCVGWRWMKALCWFHPLVWKIPAAHNLACEQEADRIASAQFEDGGSYAGLLAQLALRVLAIPSVETTLTVNGTAQIVQRLNHLGREGMRAWNWKYSVAGFGLMGAMFVLIAGCEFSKSDSANSPVYKEALVVVEDEDGKPIQGATIEPTGFRVKGRHSADAYNWHSWEKTPTKATTDRDGKAYLRYPVVAIPEEKELTEKLIFMVMHSGFATVMIQSFSVDGTEKPIQMKRGIPLEVSGYFGSDRQPVLELIPSVNGSVGGEDVRPEDWQKKENGVFAFHKLAPGGHLLQLMGRLPSGKIVYSEGFAFTAEKGKQYNFALEMKPGIRLEGRIDGNVPRPVKNGRVLINVRPKEFPPLLVPEELGDLYEKHGYLRFWKSYRPIAEDGTFLFESIPPGELDVVVHGDGFVSKSIGQVKNRRDSKLVPGLSIGIPQPFSLVAPVTKIEVITEPTATLELTARTKSGEPVEGVTVGLSPNVLRMHGIFGEMEHSSEEPFRALNPLPKGRALYSGVTDKSGAVTISNIPAFTRSFEIYHPQFEAPIQDPKGWRNRVVHVAFSPGMTNKLELILEPKGTEFIRE